ncbi:MAG: exodeoxyribonuclease III [Flavobacteriales bacterium]|nr:exodeoxyribonuclease III [Flavobacteriales bacterium]MBK6946207.1 exodeoxyribonuclease III [Flavobacteriales bacterium]MBK7238840.1 exodeoxyribonuclease III [Flavobacteriales bacterium]MBK7297587.1 exodeoxyribonuclease III [Flavobacteriales bacterium]MBK9537035.1 exodeoxyribonuclease III [Flavobacteriales bacterium]
MKLISFNVNGIRASVKKGLVDSLRTMDADIYCFQETKATPDQVGTALQDLVGYHVHAHGAAKLGYSGTAIASKVKPVKVEYGIPNGEEHNSEGRVITATFKDFIVVNTYVPNSGQELKRLTYRTEWDVTLRAYLVELSAQQLPVIFTGDLNVAHQPIDIARPKENYNKTAGYTQKEIDGMSALLATGYVDTFRKKHPELVKYSWWSQRFGMRAKNVGWRIDYVLVSPGFEKKIKDAFILNEVMGSDHCPVGIEW